jgi:hypothetical protein
MQSLQQLLVDQGMGTSLTGWTLSEATGVTLVGGEAYVVGYGSHDGNDEAFLARLAAPVPEPATSPPSASARSRWSGGGGSGRSYRRGGSSPPSAPSRPGKLPLARFLTPYSLQWVG